ncbi:hypothetical protein ABZP36_003941 [Zizania latifolia]
MRSRRNPGSGGDGDGVSTHAFGGIRSSENAPPRRLLESPGIAIRAAIASCGRLSSGSCPIRRRRVLHQEPGPWLEPILHRPRSKRTARPELPVRGRLVPLLRPVSAPTEFTQEAARQSLIAISRSVPAIGEALNIKSPNGVMANGHDEGVAKYRSKLISISNLSPDAQPAPCSPKDTAAQA